VSLWRVDWLDHLGLMPEQLLPRIFGRAYKPPVATTGERHSITINRNYTRPVVCPNHHAQGFRIRRLGYSARKWRYGCHLVVRDRSDTPAWSAQTSNSTGSTTAIGAGILYQIIRPRSCRIGPNQAHILALAGITFMKACDDCDDEKVASNKFEENLIYK
jgi:hypothetical protein